MLDTAMRNKLYFIQSGKPMEDGIVDEEDTARNVASQQLVLDSLHSYFYHTVHLNDDERKETVSK